MASAITNLLQERLGLRCFPTYILKKKLVLLSVALQKLGLSHNLCFILITVKAANGFQVISTQFRVPQQMWQRITWKE